MFSPYRLEKIKARRYLITTSTGKTVARIFKRYVHPYSNVEITRKANGRVWSRGWSVIWEDSGEREAFDRLSDIADKYAFSNWPGPGKVLDASVRRKKDVCPEQ